MQTFKLPHIYKNNNRDCYLDPIRKKLVYVTPEETVRQNVIAYLIKKLKVPKEFISVEEPISHYGVKSRDRADIIVDEYNVDADIRYPILVIECKAPDVYLGEYEENQAIKYAKLLNCAYCALTNGNDMICLYQDDESFIPIQNLPNYQDMIGNKFSILSEEPTPPRLNFNELKENFIRYVGNDIGDSTPDEIAIPLVNFFESLLDTEHKMPTGKYKLFTLIEDYGIRCLTFGNASGGRFSGPYRSFLIEYNGDTKFVSISVSSYISYAYKDLERTAIVVGIDGNETSHHALQYVVDNEIVLEGDRLVFLHSGKIAVGNQGSGKIAHLRAMVKHIYPSIVDGDKFNLGTLTHNRLWYLDDKEEMTLIENLISYSLIRDDFRELVKAGISDKYI